MQLKKLQHLGFRSFDFCGLSLLLLVTLLCSLGVSPGCLAQNASPVTIKFGYANIPTIKAALPAETDAMQNISAAAQRVADRQGLDTIVAGDGVFKGGNLIVASGPDVTEAILRELSIDVPNSSSAQVRAISRTVRVGLFNLQEVQSKFGATVSAENARTEAEYSLRAEVEAGNKELQRMEGEGKPKGEVAAATQALQQTINRRQQELIAKIQSQFNTAMQPISTAVNNLPQFRDLDLVLSGESLVAGADKVTLHGIDLTASLLAALQGGSPEVANTMAPLKDPPKDLPRKLLVQEVCTDSTSGDWVWGDTCYVCNWSNGAKSELRVEKFHDKDIIFAREDKSGVSSGLTGRYTGRWDAQEGIFKGSVTKNWQGRQSTGTWSAKF